MKTNKKVMEMAWEIAREGVKKFGGKVSEYFAEALKIAWGKVKDNVVCIEAMKTKLEAIFAKPRLGTDLRGLSLNVWEKHGMKRIYVNGVNVRGHFCFDDNMKVRKHYFDCGYDFNTRSELQAVAGLINEGAI